MLGRQSARFVEPLMLGLAKRVEQSGFHELSSVLLGPRHGLFFLLGGHHACVGVVRRIGLRAVGLRAVLGLNFLTG